MVLNPRSVAFLVFPLSRCDLKIVDSCYILSFEDDISSFNILPQLKNRFKTSFFLSITGKPLTVGISLQIINAVYF